VRTLQVHHLVRTESKDEDGFIQTELESSDLADAGSLWIFLLGSSVQFVSPCSA